MKSPNHCLRQIPTQKHFLPYRMYAEARTETIRPVTESSVQWVKAMTTVPTTKEQQILLLKKAIGAQTRLKNEAVVGQGWDRHLYAMFFVSLEIGMKPPALFQNEVGLPLSKVLF